MANWLLGPYANLKIGQNVKLPPDIIAQAIKDLMKESNSHADSVRVSIPLMSSFVKIITLPFGQDKNISAEVVGMEARRHIPFLFQKWLWIGGLYRKMKMI